MFMCEHSIAILGHCATPKARSRLGIRNSLLNLYGLNNVYKTCLRGISKRAVLDQFEIYVLSPFTK